MADAEIKIGADSSELIASLKTSVDAVKDSVGQMSGALGSLGSAFSGLGEIVGVFTAIMAGGAAFKHMVDGANEEAAAVKKLQNVFGLAASEANNLSLQLQLAGISTDDYTSMAFKLDKQVKKNEDGLKALGVQTRDSSGHLLSQKELMDSSVKTMMEYKAGTDRNEVAMALFGKSAQEVFQLQKLNNAVAQEAIDLQKLGIGPTQESLNQSIAYKASMREAGVLLEAFSNTVGEAVIPALTSIANAFIAICKDIFPIFKAAVEIIGMVFSLFGEIVSSVVETIQGYLQGLSEFWTEVFGSSLPEGMTATKAAINSVLIACNFMKLGFQGLLTAVKVIIDEFVTLLLTFSRVANKALHLDFSGAAAAWEEGTAKMREVYDKHNNAIIEKTKETKKKINALMSGKDEAEDAPKGGQKSYDHQDVKAKSDKSRMSEWEEKLAADKVGYQKENDLREMSKAQEKEYWQNILDTVKLSKQEQIAISKKVSNLDLEIMKKQSKDNRALALDEINENEKDAIAQIALKQEMAKREKDLGEMSARDLIAVNQKAEDDKFEILQDAQLKRIELQKTDPTQDAAALQSQMDKLLDIRRQHALQVEQLNTQMANQVRADFQSMLAPLDNAISTSVQGMIQGTQTLQQAMGKIMQSILASFVSSITQMVTKWAAGELAKTGISNAWAAARTALFGTEAVTSIAAKKVEAAGTIPAEAATAAGAAAASVAGIPVVGPAMAAAAYAETMGMVMGGLAVASASGGFDIPSGMNPMTQLHEEEMVLPAHIANPMRDMLSNGGGGGGSTVNINSTPLRGGFLMMHKDELAKAITALHRDNMIKFA